MCRSRLSPIALSPWSKGIYSASHILQSTPQGLSPGQVWESLHIAVALRGHHTSYSAWEDGRPRRQLLCWQHSGNTGLNKSIHHPVGSCWIPAPCKLIFHKSCCEAQRNTKFDWKHWICENWAPTVLQHVLEEPAQHQAWHSPHAKRCLGAVPGFSWSVLMLPGSWIWEDKSAALLTISSTSQLGKSLPHPSLSVAISPGLTLRWAENTSENLQPLQL